MMCYRTILFRQFSQHGKISCLKHHQQSAMICKPLVTTQEGCSDASLGEQRAAECTCGDLTCCALRTSKALRQLHRLGQLLLLRREAQGIAEAARAARADVLEERARSRGAAALALGMAPGQALSSNPHRRCMSAMQVAKNALACACMRQLM